MHQCSLVRVLLAIIVVGPALPNVLADRGMLPLADVSVFGPGQKAIVAWNGVDEVLILSTDVYADSRSTILGILPLPSKPDLIEATDWTPFTAVETLLREAKMLSEGGKGRGPGVDIVFHEKIGAHDITVVKADDADGFEKWASQFLSDLGLAKEISSERLSALVSQYIQDGKPYFVLDVTDVTSEPRSIEPIIYRFRSDDLYFPLRISAMASGSVDVAVFTISKGPIYQDQLPQFMSFATFYGVLGSPVRFRINEADLYDIEPRLAALFDGDAWFAALRYQGDLKALDADLVVRGIRPTLGDALISSPYFWLGGGVALGVLIGLLLGHISVGALGIGLGRLVSGVDFIGAVMLLILASVVGSAWAALAFWALVPIAIATLFFCIRTGGRRSIILYLAWPLLVIVLVFALLWGGALEIALSLILLTGVLLAAIFPPAGQRRLTDALRRRSRWVVASTRKRTL